MSDVRYGMVALVLLFHVLIAVAFAWWFVPVAYLVTGIFIRLVLLHPACGPVVTWRVLVGWAWGLVDDRGIAWTRS